MHIIIKMECVIQLMVVLHPAPIRFVLIINLVNLGRKIKIAVSSFYISKLLSCGTDLLFCVMNVLSFSMANTKERILINLALPGEFIHLYNTY